MVFQWSLSDSKSPQVTRTHLSFMAVLNNVVVWMVFTHPPTSKYSSPFSNPLAIVPNAPITICIIITCIFHSFFFQFPSKVEVHILVFTFFLILFCGQPGLQSQQFCNFSFLFFLLIIIRPGLLAEIWWCVCMWKSHRCLYVLFSRTGAWCIYYFFLWSNLNFLHTTLPTRSCLVLYSFCANLLQSLIMWLMVSLLSPHRLRLLFCCVSSILALIWLVLMALFCAAIRRDSVYLLKFPFLSHVQVLWSEMLFLWDFHITVSWWCFTGVWVTASLLKSPGLFSVFWSSSIM